MKRGTDVRVLPSVSATPEQLPIVLNDKPGVAVLRGAAGSGKTSTALLRLRQLCSARVSRQRRLKIEGPVRVLVLTYTRSLAGYIAALADEQVEPSPALVLEVDTFARWAQRVAGPMTVMGERVSREMITSLRTSLTLDASFLVDEVDYALGRFPRRAIDDYLVRDRGGRGSAPRVDKRRFLDEVLRPYLDLKDRRGQLDWNDLAEATGAAPPRPYDVIIIDEAQDFSANQVRGVLAHQASEASVTFVLDSVQRIYPRFFTWREVGLDANQFVLNARLTANLRNTRQIAAFARPFVAGLPVDENGQLPDFTSATSDGPTPGVFEGTFSQQSAAIIRHLATLDLDNESVGILHPLGGGWFDTLKGDLRAAGIDHVNLAGRQEWPAGPINVGLSTLHSAKGLEFDHVIVCGVTGRTAGAPDDEEDTSAQNLRRLLAMGFGRAKKSVLMCHDPSIPTAVLKYLDPATYVEVLQ